MAKWITLTEGNKAAYAEWLESRPQIIKDMIAEHNLKQDVLYRLKTTGQLVTLYSVCEDSTVTVDISPGFNPGMFIGRLVFGIDPRHLEECDLPKGVLPAQGVDPINEQATVVAEHRTVQ